MAELDNIPQTQTVELAQVKLDDSTFEKIKELNARVQTLLLEVGSIYIRRKEMEAEILRMADVLETHESEIKSSNIKLNDMASEIDDKYPQARINIADGTVQYQPGAPTRKQQQAEQAQQQNGASDFKVVKD
jgi:site-specific recombinase